MAGWTDGFDWDEEEVCPKDGIAFGENELPGSINDGI